MRTYVIIIAFLGAYNAFGAGELTRGNLANLALMSAQAENAQNGSPKKFLEYVLNVQKEVNKLNREGFGLSSTILEKAATNFVKIATEATNTFKIKNNTTSTKDLNALGKRLQSMDQELSNAKQAISKESFWVEKRQQAKDYLLKAIPVLEDLLDDAISSIPRYP